MYSVDHNDTFDHMYCTERDTLLNILNIMLKYQYLAAVVTVLNLKGGSVILGPDPFQTNVPFYLVQLQLSENGPLYVHVHKYYFQTYTVIVSKDRLCLCKQYRA